MTDERQRCPRPGCGGRLEPRVAGLACFLRCARCRFDRWPTLTDDERFAIELAVAAGRGSTAAARLLETL